MSLASLTSEVTCIAFLDNIGIQLNFTGAPVGAFDIQVSIDYDKDKGIPGTWLSLPLTPAPSAAGAPGSIYLDLNQLSAPFIRVVYTKTSGTGTLNSFISGKML